MATKKKISKKGAKPKGRKSTYTLQKAKKICLLTASSSKSLKTICNEIGIPVGTVLEWLRVKEDFSKIYARAKEEQADLLAEEIIEISDDATNDFMTITKGDETYEVENKEWTSRSKLRVDARKWVAAHLKPKKYSDKLDIEHSGNMAITWKEEKTYEAKSETDDSA